MFPFGETVTVVTPLGRDDLGNTLPGTETATEVAGCAVAAGSSVEPFALGRETVTTDYQVFMPPGTVVAATDRLRIRGDLCDVVGRPNLVRNPFTGWEPGVVVNANIGEG